MPRATGGSTQKFCCAGHRQQFWIAARRWTMRAIEAGLLSVDCLKASHASVRRCPRGVPVVDTTLIAGAYWAIGSECEISRPDACWQRIHSGYADRVSRPNDSTSYQATIPTRVAGIRSRLAKPKSPGAELAPGIDLRECDWDESAGRFVQVREVILSPEYDAIEGRRIYCGGVPEFRDYVQLSPRGARRREAG